MELVGRWSLGAGRGRFRLLRIRYHEDRLALRAARLSPRVFVWNAEGTLATLANGLDGHRGQNSRRLGKPDYRISSPSPKLSSERRELQNAVYCRSSRRASLDRLVRGTG